MLLWLDDHHDISLLIKKNQILICTKKNKQTSISTALVCNSTKKANIKRNYTHLTPPPPPNSPSELFCNPFSAFTFYNNTIFLNAEINRGKTHKYFISLTAAILWTLCFWHLALLTFPVLYDKWIESRELSRSLELKNQTADCDYTHTTTVLQSHYNSSHFCTNKEFQYSLTVFVSETEYFCIASSKGVLFSAHTVL